MQNFDLFDVEEAEVAADAPWRLHEAIFDEHFWSNIIAKMWVSANENPLALKQHLIIVPDASMYVPFQKAWAAHARKMKVACMMPRMMTLLDWAKSRGASDVDMGHTARVLDWMTQLQNTPQLAQWLGASDDVHLFEVARGLIDMSDELSLHLLAGRDIADGAVALSDAVDAVFESNAGVFARQELNVLLQCWRADVAVGLNTDSNSPVLKYLRVLHELTQTLTNETVWVVRNRPWAAFEDWFWRGLAQVTAVELFDVSHVRARVNGARVAQLNRVWGEAEERIALPLADTNTAQFDSTFQVVRSDNLEDEAQAVTRQVLAWREQGLKNIGLVALDRQVSRRVWALLARCGVTIRDDTGWLLATARSASSWRMGLGLFQDEVLATELMDWVSHPMVLSQFGHTEKRLLERHLKSLALRQKHLARSWFAWRNLARDNPPEGDVAKTAEGLSCDIQQMTVSLFEQGLTLGLAWRRKASLAQWAAQMVVFGRTFGMWQAWENDPAGAVWLNLIEKWQTVTIKTPLDLSTFLRIADAEVEAATFRPHDVSDEVLLLPLGSTRMRMFDAVWLMGADARNLPSGSNQIGLLNTAVRTELRLPTHLDAQVQAKKDFIDLIATTPQVVASYCGQKDGAPNAKSTWLAQWLRSSDVVESVLSLTPECIVPKVQTRSAAVVTAYVPVEVSASDLSQLAACPYQYYVQQVLKLRLDEMPSDEVSPADRGNWWHKIIRLFHQNRIANKDDVQQLIEQIDALLMPKCKQNARYWAVREQFLGFAAPYVAWWQSREADGWQIEHSEKWLENPQTIAIGETVKPLLWKGKIDQVDVRERINGENHQVQREHAVIDYKTGSTNAYAKKIKQNDDIQLAFYANLFDDVARTQMTQAGYIGVTDEIPKPHAKGEKPHQGDTTYPQAWLNASQIAPNNDDLIHAATELHLQVNDNFKRMYAGEALQALGELKACEWCNVRGLCRKGYTVTY